MLFSTKRKTQRNGHKHHIREIAVIGLGRFGSAVASRLMSHGIHVLGIDQSPALTQKYAGELTQTAALDSTNEAALREIGIGNFDTVVVAIGTNFESSLITAVNCKHLGVRNVIAKAMSNTQHDILLKVGVDRVVLPEREAGERIAQEIVGTGVLGKMLLDCTHSIAEIKVPLSFVGMTLRETDMRKKYGVNVMAVERAGDVVLPGPEHVFDTEDKLVVLGSEAEIQALCDKY